MSEVTEFTEGELVRVAVRYKAPGATPETPADSTESGLLTSALAGEFSQLDDPTRWAAVVANLAELLHGSPYADAAAYGFVAETLAPLAGNDAKRTELVAYFNNIAGLLANTWD